MDSTTIKKQNRLATLIMHSATLSGRIALLAFVFFIWMGPFEVLQISLPPQGWFYWDLFLSSLFFVQHSLMIRQGSKAQMARFIPPHYHGAVYTLASSFILIIVVLFWQPSQINFFEAPAFARWMANGLFILAAAGMAWGVWTLRSFDPFGARPIKAHMSGKPLKMPSIAAKGPYLWTRHPLYFFLLVMIWCRADLTADRLLFNIAWTGWVIVGTLLEEKDLVSEYGETYQRYQKQVPMLIPWKWSKKDQEDNC